MFGVERKNGFCRCPLVNGKKGALGGGRGGKEVEAPRLILEGKKEKKNSHRPLDDHSSTA